MNLSPNKIESTQEYWARIRERERYRREVEMAARSKEQQPVGR